MELDIKFEETSVEMKTEFGEVQPYGTGDIDLSNYYRKQEIDTKINELNEQINMKQGATIGQVTLPSSGWVGNASPYSQVVSIKGVTENSQVDLTPSVEQLTVFYEKDLTFVTENEDGIVTVYAIGQKPQNDYTIQVTITEVLYG